LFDTGDPLEGDLNDKPLNHFVLGGSILHPIPQSMDDRFIQFTLIVDGNEVYNTVYTESGVYRLPSGYKGTIFELKISGNVEFRYIKVAETMKELKSL